MQGKYLPTFTVDRAAHLKQLPPQTENYGLLLTVSAPDHLLKSARDFGKPVFIDSGVFQSGEWYKIAQCEFIERRWQRFTIIAPDDFLKDYIRRYYARCANFSPHYVFAIDVYGEPELSLHLADLGRQVFQEQSYRFELIGVVQVGDFLYHWQSAENPGGFAPLSSPKAIAAIQNRVNHYRTLGYELIALGGLLRKTKVASRTGLTFGLSKHELEVLIQILKPDFILAGLSLTRSRVLSTYGVSADSTNWLWWKFDPARFQDRDPMAEILKPHGRSC
jgi:hypothetical protein